MRFSHLQSFARKVFPVVFLLVASQLVAQPPSGYYNAANGLTGTALQAALHSIIKGHTSISYNGIPGYFPSTDPKPNNVVWDMYSDVPGGTPPYVYHYNVGDECGNYSGEGDCYNREHSWPKSWFNDASPMYSDMFHIYPTDGYVNGKRNNYPYGTVSSASWTSQNGCKLGSCTWPGYSGTVFEPLNEYKGDFARTYFYMSTRYYTEDASWNVTDMTNKSQLKPWALQMMLHWATIDPVSAKETARNNAVYAIQHNRNPFIDNPGYATLIWGTATGIGDQQAISVVATVYPNPAADFVHIDLAAAANTENLELTIVSVGGPTNSVTWSVSGNTVTLDVRSLPKGIYFVLLTDGATRYHAKLVRQ